MPEPREPMMPLEPVCTCHGWPGSVCDKRAASARERLGRLVARACVAGWAGAAGALVASAYLRQPTALGTLAAALCGASSGVSVVLLLFGGRRG